MTLVCAVEFQGGTVVACDSYNGSDELRDVMDRPKWVRNGPVLIACSGSQRAMQVAQYATKFRYPKKGEEDLAYLIDAVAEPIREAIDDADAADGECGLGSIVVFRGRAYLIDEAFGVTRSSYGYCAIGAGACYALALLGYTGTLKMDAKTRALTALEWVERHCSLVSRPFTHITMSR